MTALRVHFGRHARWAALLLAAVLLVRLLVPAGYMIGRVDGAVTVQPCSGFGPVPAAMPGMAHHGDDDDGGRQRVEQPCAFAGLAAPVLGGGEAAFLLPVLPVSSPVLIALRSSEADRPRPFLRPPPRGPPAASLT